MPLPWLTVSGSWSPPLPPHRLDPMATQAIESAPAGDDAGSSAASDAPKSSSKRSVLILAIAGVAAGAATGLFGVGPVLAKRRSASVAAPKTEVAAKTSVAHSVENLVLNPAGSGGTRFLMVTAT